MAGTSGAGIFRCLPASADRVAPVMSARVAAKPGPRPGHAAPPPRPRHSPASPTIHVPSASGHSVAVAGGFQRLRCECPPRAPQSLCGSTHQRDPPARPTSATHQRDPPARPTSATHQRDPPARPTSASHQRAPPARVPLARPTGATPGQRTSTSSRRKTAALPGPKTLATIWPLRRRRARNPSSRHGPAAAAAVTASLPATQCPRRTGPARTGLLGTGIFVGCLAGGFAGMCLSNDAKQIVLWSVLTFASIITGTVMVALGVSSRKAAWSAVGALFGVSRGCRVLRRVCHAALGYALPSSSWLSRSAESRGARHPRRKFERDMDPSCPQGTHGGLLQALRQFRHHRRHSFGRAGSGPKPCRRAAVGSFLVFASWPLSESCPGALYRPKLQRFVTCISTSNTLIPAARCAMRQCLLRWCARASAC